MKSKNELNLTELFRNVPLNVKAVSAYLKHNGFEAYLVGGCVRDHVMGRIPSDYDFCTNATPEQVIALFPRTFYENTYGTVGVVTAPESETDEKIVKESIVEVTPYRLESNYENNRHPSEVTWSSNLFDDLARRDFTCNALAYDLQNETLIDEYEGLKDIENKTLKCVGQANARLSEDALRMLRAVRFACQLSFEIETVTRESIKKNAYLLDKISKERIRDEFNKILMTSNPKLGIELAHELGVLKFISHEIEAGIGIEQNQAHSFDVWKHNLLTCQHAADKDWPLELRLSALFHDVSKPETRRFSKEKHDYTFYGHDVVGGRVAREILERLKYPKETIDYVSGMVRWHMFFSDTEQVTLSAVRRLISNVGKDKVWDLMNLRICDRVGTGRPKENPYRFRMYKSMVEQAMTDPVSLKMLKIDGSKIMTVTQETPGPRIGLILHALFAEVLEDPNKNTESYLNERALQLKTLDIKDLKVLADSGKEGMDEKNAEQVTKIRDKFHVK